jgi:hypothetical protein
MTSIFLHVFFSYIQLTATASRSPPSPQQQHQQQQQQQQQHVSTLVRSFCNEQFLINPFGFKV